MVKVLGRANQAGEWLQTNANWPKKRPRVSSELDEQGPSCFAQALSAPSYAGWRRRKPGSRREFVATRISLEHFASHFELSCLALCPLLSGFSQDYGKRARCTRR